MTIFTSLYAIPNHDRIESWRGAFRYLKQAEPLFQVRPIIKINLINGRKSCRVPTITGPRKTKSTFTTNAIRAALRLNRFPFTALAHALVAAPSGRLEKATLPTQTTGTKNETATETGTNADGNTLATKTRKCLTTHPQAGLPHQCAETGPDFNEQQPSGLRFALVCALNAVGLVAGLALAFGLLVLAGAIMRELGIYGGL